MTGRERVLTALRRRRPDRVPIDLGGTKNSSIHIVAYERLKRYLGISVPTEPRLADRMMQIVDMDEAVLQRLDVDTRAVYEGPPDRPRGRIINQDTYADEWGVVRRKVPGGYSYDLLHSPLSGEITVADIANYPRPDPLDPGILRPIVPRIEHLRRTDCALVLHLPSAFVHKSQYLMGFEDWFLNIALNPSLMGSLFDAILEVSMAQTEQLLNTAGHLVDVVNVADDIADQRGPIVSPPAYRKLIAPRLLAYFEFIRARTSVPILYHTCGSLYEIMHDLVALGVQALNPVQVSARDMDTARLKRAYGDQVAFWGAVDTQKVLPFGTPEDVRTEVRQRICDLGPGGGYILAAVHNIQPEVPPENIVAMIEAAREFGLYETAN
jgi:uroporphyrinogen decarboxylase